MKDPSIVVENTSQNGIRIEMRRISTILILVIGVGCSQNLSISIDTSFETRSSFSYEDGYSLESNTWEVRDSLLIKNGVELQSEGIWILRNKPDQRVIHHLVSFDNKKVLYEIRIGRETSVSIIKVVEDFKDMKNLKITSYINSIK